MKHTVAIIFILFFIGCNNSKKLEDNNRQKQIQYLLSGLNATPVTGDNFDSLNKIYHFSTLCVKNIGKSLYFIDSTWKVDYKDSGKIIYVKGL